MDRLSGVLILFGTLLAVVAWPIAFGLTQIQALQSFINSNFATTFLSTLVAAFAGAWGAQNIVERTKDKESYIAEIRNTNAAIALSFTICNACLGYKTQHIQSLRERYYVSKGEYFLCLYTPSIEPVEILFQPDFRTLQFPTLPAELLEKQVFEKISAIRKTLVLTITISQCIQSFNRTNDMRNDLIAKFKTMNLSPADLAHVYYGFSRNGFCDTIYSDLIDALNDQLNDCIYYTLELIEELGIHGESIRTKMGKNAPSISKPRFAKAYEDGLIPDAALYASWKKAFT